MPTARIRTLNTFHQIKNQHSAHDQAFLNRAKQLTEIETNWNKKSEQQLKKQEKQNQQAERKQDERKYKLEEEVKKRVCEILQKERKQLKQQQMQEQVNEEQAKEEERKRKRELKTTLIEERKTVEEEMKTSKKTIDIRIQTKTKQQGNIFLSPFHSKKGKNDKCCEYLMHGSTKGTHKQLNTTLTHSNSIQLIPDSIIMNKKSENLHQLMLKVQNNLLTLTSHITHTNNRHRSIVTFFR